MFLKPVTQPVKFSPRMRGCSVAGVDARVMHIGFPRVCGDVPTSASSPTPGVKFSPRMRGCSLRVRGSRGVGLVFPAYAGMFRWCIIFRMKVCRFPRVCGDVPINYGFWRRLQQFSPRMRGCSAFDCIEGSLCVVFPAYAGMFRRCERQQCTTHGFPRVCGDVPLNRYTPLSSMKFSPRMRGCS